MQGSDPDRAQFGDAGVRPRSGAVSMNDRPLGWGPLGSDPRPVRAVLQVRWSDLLFLPFGSERSSDAQDFGEADGTVLLDRTVCGLAHGH